MSEQASTTNTPDAAIAEAIRELQAKAEDLAIRAARRHGWCNEVEKILAAIFPNGPLDGEAFRTSDGVDCNGEMWLDADGYNRAGFNRQGRDRDGFDSDGRDADGFDREGLDRAGIHRDSPERYRYNLNGFDADGFNADGYDWFGHTREQAAAQEFIYDRNGRTREGFDQYGYDRHGYNVDGLDSGGYGRDGFNANNEDRSGRTRDGVNRRGMRIGADEINRVADTDKWRAYYGYSEDTNPEHAGYHVETPEQAAAARAAFEAATAAKLARANV